MTGKKYEYTVVSCLLLIIVIIAFNNAYRHFTGVDLISPRVESVSADDTITPDVSPTPTPTIEPKEEIVEKPVEKLVIYQENSDMTSDELVGFYVDEYFNNASQRSEMRMIMHCLLHRESRHDSDKTHGDGGRAGGPLQFHSPTWEGYRRKMIDEGLVIEIGSRYDLEQAIHTTVWAIKNHRSLAWGPILRDSQGSNYAACQRPSWE